MFIILFDNDNDTATLACPFCAHPPLRVPEGMTYRDGATDPRAEDVIREHEAAEQIEGGVEICTNREAWKTTRYEVRDATRMVLDSGNFEVPRAPRIQWDV